MRLLPRIQAGAFILALSACLQSTGRSAESQSLVSFPSDGRTLSGFISKPKGNGPFKALIFNHGSERRPGLQRDLATYYNKNGFVFFIPHRTGHGRSPSIDIRDRIAPFWDEMGFRLAVVQRLELANDDVVAAVEWLRTQPFVDPNRIVMSGYSFGGIQTLLTAEKGLGIRAFIAFTPAAMSWRNHILRQRLLTAVERAKAPLFLIQAANDFSTGPSEVLGPEIRSKGPPNRAKLYPAFGSTRRDAHVRFTTRTPGIDIWGSDVISFLEAIWSNK